MSYPFRFLIVIAFLIVSEKTAFAQKRNYRICAAAFYNLENLFDTINDPEKNDEEFTPT